jgi:protease-4
MSSGKYRRWAGLGAVLALAFGCDRGSGETGSGTTTAIGMLRSGLDKASGGVLVELDLSHGLSEKAPQLGFLSAPSSPTHAELVQTLARASSDRRTRGFFIRLGESDLSWAQAEELSRTLGALPPEQPVVCHAHAYTNATLLFALRACDKVWLSPAGEVSSVGIASQMLYLKRLFDRFKIKADFLHMGKYKSFAEMFTEDGPTDAARESLESVLGSIRQTWLDGLAASTTGQEIHSAGKEIQKLAEYGPWPAEVAREAGLIDTVGYVSDARDYAKESTGVDTVETAFGVQAHHDASDEITQLIRFVAGTSPSQEKGEHIVVLPTSGSINMTSGGVLGSGDSIAAEPLGRTLKRLRENDAVKAVVIRIDSPGGSALASDLIWHDLMELRAKKPLIASLAGTAASGGYYMACAATRILAERTSIIGSIGVVGGKMVIGETLDDLGVTGVTFPASKEPGAANRAAYLSFLSTWDDATRESVRAEMSAVYELFLQRVAQGRDLPIDSVREIAQGRIWSGAQGLDSHLVDGLGGLADAIALAKKQAGLDESAEVKIEGSSESLLQFLKLDSDPDEASLRAALLRLRSSAPGPLEALAEPLRPYLSSLAPLLGRERVLTALPVAIEVH